MQLANIGAEVGRAIRAKKSRDIPSMNKACWRALELFDATIDDPKNRFRLGEVVRLREVFLDYLVGDNRYGSTDEWWESYFLTITVIARRPHR
jgi:hypothetical protein